MAGALGWAAGLAAIERDFVEVDRLASELIEVSTENNFLLLQSIGNIHRGWARGVSGNTTEGILWIEKGITDYRAAGWVLGLPFHLAQKAEVLHLADRTSEALNAIQEGQKVGERSEERQWRAELHRLRGLFLAALGDDETQIEASFCAAIRIAREQKSIPLEKRAAGTYAEYRSQKANATGGRGFRISLW